MLAGTIVRARLYDRALAADEVAASAAAGRADPSTPSDRGRRCRRTAAERARERLVEQSSRLRLASSPDRRKAYAVAPQAGRRDAPCSSAANPAQPGEVVAPGGVAALAGPGRRLRPRPPTRPRPSAGCRLAEWITDPSNPLFARVIVNRLWHHHFGAGLVDTPSDFGFNGGRPTHPELLDWLAAELVDGGWSLKAMHRLIVTSATYRQSSRPTPERTRDRRRQPPALAQGAARLEAEAVRDAMLAASGQLEPGDGRAGLPRTHRHQVPGRRRTLYDAVEPVGPELQPPQRSTGRWARGGRSPLARRLRLPRPLDDRAPTRPSPRRRCRRWRC